jgi:hypothetical protein
MMAIGMIRKGGGQLAGEEEEEWKGIDGKNIMREFGW